MRRGLVVGKFMPLHRGHQLLIETALANVDELTVVVYNTNVGEEWEKLMPAWKRAGWVSRLYPNIENIVVWPDTLPGDYKEHDDPAYARHYAEELQFLGPFTHVFSSEAYGEPFAQAINTIQVEEHYRKTARLGNEPRCYHVEVDAARNLMPISGTLLRDKLFEYRAYVDPLVYRSLIQKVVFVGTESTGKSTLAKRMAEEYETMYTSEYGRTLWVQKASNGIKPSFSDLLLVGRTQYEQEQAAALHSNRFLFCDTNAWTTMLWSEMYYNTADQRLIDLARDTMDEYIWILCNNDFGWVDDGTRELKDGKSNWFQRVNRDTLNEWGIDYWQVTGPLEERVKQVKSILASPVLEYAV